MNIVELNSAIEKVVIKFEDGTEKEVKDAFIAQNEGTGMSIQPVKISPENFAMLLTTVVMMSLEGALSYED